MILVTPKYELLFNKPATVMLQQNKLERCLLAGPFQLSPIFAGKARRGAPEVLYTYWCLSYKNSSSLTLCSESLSMASYLKA